MDLGIILKRARKEKGLTLREAAGRLPIHPTTLQRYESGRIKKIPLEIVKALADLYQIPPEKLPGVLLLRETLPAKRQYPQLTGSTDFTHEYNEQTLFEQFKCLDQRGKRTIAAMIHFEYQRLFEQNKPLNENETLMRG